MPKRHKPHVVNVFFVVFAANLCDLFRLKSYIFIYCLLYYRWCSRSLNFESLNLMV